MVVDQIELEDKINLYKGLAYTTATEGMKQLIDYGRADEEINEALIDIT